MGPVRGGRENVDRELGDCPKQTVTVIGRQLRQNTGTSKLKRQRGWIPGHPLAEDTVGTLATHDAVS